MSNGKGGRPRKKMTTEESNSESNSAVTVESNSTARSALPQTRPLLNSLKQEKQITKLLDALEVAAATNTKPPKSDRGNLTKHRPGPRNGRDRIIFQLMVLGVPTPIIAGRSMLAETSIFSLRQRWMDDGSLSRVLKLRQDENEALLESLNSKALMVLNDAMDDGDATVRVAAAKSVTVAASNAAARRQKEKTDTAFVEIGKESNELFAQAIAKYQTRQPPAWLQQRTGQAKQLPVDTPVDVEYEVVSTRVETDHD